MSSLVLSSQLNGVSEQRGRGVCDCACVIACVRMCVCTCACVSMRIRARVCLCVCVYVCVTNRPSHQHRYRRILAGRWVVLYLFICAYIHIKPSSRDTKTNGQTMAVFTVINTQNSNIDSFCLCQSFSPSTLLSLCPSVTREVAKTLTTPFSRSSSPRACSQITTSCTDLG